MPEVPGDAGVMTSRRRALRLLGLSAASCFAARPTLFAAQANDSPFRAAAQYSAARTGVAMLVLKGGRVVFEDYPGGSSRVPCKIYSGTKGFWILAALKAVEEEIIDLDETAAQTLPEWRQYGEKGRVTLRQLLNFSSGLDAGHQLHGDGFKDRNAIALRTPLVASPGAAFIYGPAPLLVFHEVMKRKLAARGQTPTKFLERKVLSPLGLGPQRYLADKAGNPLLATGFMMTARQWARMGELILNGGSPVVPSRLLAQCFRGSDANCAFGKGFWNNTMAARGRELDVEDTLEPKWNRQNWRAACLCRDAPSDLVAAIGSGYQRLFVIPSRQLVVVRQGRFGKFSDGNFLRLVLGKA